MQCDKFAIGRTDAPDLFFAAEAGVAVAPCLLVLFSASSRPMSPLRGPRTIVVLCANAGLPSLGWCIVMRAIPNCPAAAILGLCVVL